MSGWATTILVAGWSRRNDSDLSRGTEFTRLGADSLGRASAKAEVATAPVVRSATVAHSAVARLRGLNMGSGKKSGRLAGRIGRAAAGDGQRRCGLRRGRGRRGRPPGGS